MAHRVSRYVTQCKSARSCRNPATKSRRTVREESERFDADLAGTSVGGKRRVALHFDAEASERGMLRYWIRLHSRDARQLFD